MCGTGVVSWAVGCACLTGSRIVLRLSRYVMWKCVANGGRSVGNGLQRRARTPTGRAAGARRRRPCGRGAGRTAIRRFGKRAHRAPAES